MKTILVPIDGSDNSIRAMEKAKEIADCLGSKIILLNVLNLSSALSYYHHNARLTQDSKSLDWHEIVNKDKADSQELLEKSKQALGNTDVETVMLDVPGAELAHTITKYAEECGADMIVIGSNGMGSLAKRLYMGSVTNKLLHITNKPVLVVQ